MGKRSKDWNDPYLTTTVGEFLKGVKDSGRVQVALDVPCPQLVIPSPLKYV